MALLMFSLGMCSVLHPALPVLLQQQQLDEPDVVLGLLLLLLRVCRLSLLPPGSAPTPRRPPPGPREPPFRPQTGRDWLMAGRCRRLRSQRGGQGLTIT